jgi:heme/copper-type cytochrome/quinol oxidase subunit 3
MLKNSINLIPARKQLYQAKLFFYLFLASLGMFFVASLISYLVIREQAFSGHPEALPNSPMSGGPDRFQPLVIPISFWISTVALVFVSYFLQQAVWSVQKQRLSRMRMWLGWSLLGAVVFVAIQSFGMVDLLSQHFSASDGSTKIFGMSFTLSFIHVLHVVGGMVFLGYVIFQAARDRYDHERHWAVDHCASYWHFLDIVWVCMLATFFVAS